MTKSELGQLKAQRHMILGAISEMPEEEQRAIQGARAALTSLVTEGGDPGRLALAIVALDFAITEEPEE